MAALDSSYRPDVDGLRAIAVGVVVLHHCGWCPGGFLGVDVFFVISGYLIAGLILREQRAGIFSLAGFWERRFRRLIPALTLMLLGTLGLGAVALLPGELCAVARAALAQCLLAANFYARSSIRYFAPDASQHPLLHTWSLAVEEQFYLFFPLLMMALAARPRLRQAALLALFLGSLWLCTRWSGVRPAANFYLLPTRLWELALGAWLAPCPVSLPRRTHEPLAALALLTLLGSIAVFRPSLAHPGLATLIPCAATGALLVLQGGRPTWTGRALARSPLVALGLISYGLYLWHWPLLSLSYLWFPSWPWRLLAVLTALALAALSYRFVEKPARDRRRWTRRQVFAGALLAHVVVIGLSLAVLGAAGWPGRFPEAVLALARAEFSDDVQITEQQVESGQLPVLGAPGPPSFLLWGDSHAMAVSRAVDAAARACGRGGLQLTHSETPPGLGLRLSAQFAVADPDRYTQAALSFLRQRKIRTVLLVAAWRSYVSKVPGFRDDLARLLAELDAMQVEVWLVKDNPDLPWLPTRRVLLAHLSGEPPSSISLSARDYTRQEAVAAPLYLLHPERWRDVSPWLSQDGRFPVYADGLLYFDRGHLSLLGARRLEPLFRELLRSGAL